jgi:hypothetical protein
LKELVNLQVGLKIALVVQSSSLSNWSGRCHVEGQSEVHFVF